MFWLTKSSKCAACLFFISIQVIYMGDLNYRIDGLADDIVKMRAIVATTVDTTVSKIENN
jgi:hypothetical protein